MSHGIEVRSPFLDWRMVAFSFTLSRRSTLGAGYTKRILRDAMINRLPKAIRTRTSKVGFGSPMESLVMNEFLRNYTLDSIRSQDYLNTSLFDGKKLSQKIENAYKDNDAKKIVKLWPTVQAILLKTLLRSQEAGNS